MLKFLFQAQGHEKKKCKNLCSCLKRLIKNFKKNFTNTISSVKTNRLNTRTGSFSFEEIRTEWYAEIIREITHEGEVLQ